jgi:hypothetical protein
MPMDNDSQTPPPGASYVASHRGRFYVGVLAVVASIVIAGAMMSRDSKSATPSATSNAAESSTTATSAIVSTRTEVTSRLREILAIRDRALVARDAHLLSDIYTIDCECLEDGKALIQQLRKQDVVWKGVKTKIDIRSAEEVNDRLWIVIATVETPSVQIETEAGRLVRIVPPERNLVRFALGPAPIGYGRRRGRLSQRYWVQARRTSRPQTMAALTSASQNATTSRRRSVHQRSLPYWLAQA